MVYIGSLDYDEQIKMAAEIIIFGGGSMLPCLLEKMEQLNITGNIIAICDNDTAMHGKEICDISVFSPEYIFENYGNSDFIVYNQYFMEICEQLRKNHITRIHLIRQGSL